MFLPVSITRQGAQIGNLFYGKRALLFESRIQKTHTLLKRGIWLYFLLLIFEGALRKWTLPFLSTPLLVIRDPLAFWLLYTAWKNRMFPNNFYIISMISIGMLSIVFALLFGHGNLMVTIFGARIFILQFPLMFLIGKIFNRQEVLSIGKAMLIMSIPMAILIIFQFFSPQSALVNRGVGGSIEGSGFSGALGYFRPSGTFSFTSGNTQFFSLLACFIFYYWLQPETVNRIILILATAALLIAIPLSISRTLFFQVGITFLFAIFSISRNPRHLRKILIFGTFVFIGIALLGNTSVFQIATEVFSARFENASNVEGGIEGTLIDRFLGGLLSAIAHSYDKPFFGYGIGMGTNVGSMLLGGGGKFLIAEEEWARTIGEIGTLMGLAVIFIRLRFVTALALVSFQNLRSNGLLSWMLLSFGLLIIAQGQWAQPTTLGFSTLLGGLMIASLNTEETGKNTHHIRNPDNQ